jgi:hypothetical protein
MNYPNAIRSLEASKKKIEKEFAKVEPKYLRLKAEVEKINKAIRVLKGEPEESKGPGRPILRKNSPTVTNVILKILAGAYPEGVRRSQLIKYGSKNDISVALSRLKKAGKVNNPDSGYWVMTDEEYEAYTKANKEEK